MFKKITDLFAQTTFIHNIIILMPTCLVMMFLEIFKVFDERTLKIVFVVAFVPDILFMIITSIMMAINYIKEKK